MEKNKLKPLTDYSESHRKKAVAKFKIIEPYFKGNVSIKDISKQENIPIRTLYRWKKAHDYDGLKCFIHQVYRIVKNGPKDLITLSQEGSKSYKTKFDLIHHRKTPHKLLGGYCASYFTKEKNLN